MDSKPKCYWYLHVREPKREIKIVAMCARAMLSSPKISTWCGPTHISGFFVITVRNSDQLLSRFGIFTSAARRLFDVPIVGFQLNCQRGMMFFAF